MRNVSSTCLYPSASRMGSILLTDIGARLSAANHFTCKPTSTVRDSICTSGCCPMPRKSTTAIITAAIIADQISEPARAPRTLRTRALAVTVDLRARECFGTQENGASYCATKAARIIWAATRQSKMPAQHTPEWRGSSTVRSPMERPMDNPTFCSRCDKVHPLTRNEDPWRWRCMAVPIPPGYGFVSPDFSPSPPFARCDQTNKHGDCPMFSPKREAPDDYVQQRTHR